MANSIATTIIEIFIPAGKLGIVIDASPENGCAYVSEILDGCPIRNEMKAKVGDKIIKVDDEDVFNMKAIFVRSKADYHFGLFPIQY